MQLTLTTFLLLSPLLLSTAVEAVCSPHPHGPRRHHTAKKNSSRTSITLSSSPKSLKGLTASAQLGSVQHSSSSAVKANATESITTTTRAWSSRKSSAASSAASPSTTPASSSAPASPSPSKSGSSGHGGCKVHANGICIGMVPDDGKSLVLLLDLDGGMQRG